MRDCNKSRGVGESEESGKSRGVEESQDGMSRALSDGMRAEKLEDLLICTKALEGIDAVSTILRGPNLIKDFDLNRQLSESSGKIPSLRVVPRSCRHAGGVHRLPSTIRSQGPLVSASPRLSTTLLDSTTLADSKTLPTPSDSSRLQ
jgi:hypothetical protein